MTRYIFGPVPSRRLGRSLGVDLLPFKTCTYNCVYCECGPTTHLTTERAEFVPLPDVIAGLDQVLSHEPDLDYITFAGSGEPTLSLSLGPVIAHLKTHYSRYPVAVITNGSFCTRADVRNDLLIADLVIPTLTTADQRTFETIHRPAPGLLIGDVITGLAEMRSTYSGRIWLEVFLVPGINTTENELAGLRGAIHQIQPDRIQLNTLDRPGSEAWVTAPGMDELERVRAYLAMEGIPVDSISTNPGSSPVSLSEGDLLQQIEETLRRRPCTTRDIARMTGCHITEISKQLARLTAAGKVRTKRGERGIFYFVVTGEPAGT